MTVARLEARPTGVYIWVMEAGVSDQADSAMPAGQEVPLRRPRCRLRHQAEPPVASREIPAASREAPALPLALPARPREAQEDRAVSKVKTRKRRNGETRKFDPCLPIFFVSPFIYLWLFFALPSALQRLQTSCLPPACYCRLRAPAKRSSVLCLSS